MYTDVPEQKEAAITAVCTCPGNGRAIWDEVPLVVVLLLLPLCTGIYK